MKNVIGLFISVIIAIIGNGQPNNCELRITSAKENIDNNQMALAEGILSEIVFNKEGIYNCSDDQHAEAIIELFSALRSQKKHEVSTSVFEGIRSKFGQKENIWAQSVYQYALVQNIQGKNAEVIKLLDEAIFLFNKLDDTRGQSKAHNLMASNMMGYEIYAERMNHRHQAIRYAKDIEIEGDSISMVIYNNLLNDHMLFGNTDSITHYIDFLDESITKMDSVQAMTFTYMAGLFESYKANTSGFLDYLLKSLNYSKGHEDKDLENLPAIYQGLSICYSEYGNYTQAEIWAREAIEYNMKLQEKNEFNDLRGQNEFLCSNYSSLSDAFYGLGKEDEALDALYQGLHYGLLSGASQVNIQLPAIQYGLARHFTYFDVNIDSAQHYINHSTQNFNQIPLALYGLDDLGFMSMALKFKIHHLNSEVLSTGLFKETDETFNAILRKGESQGGITTYALDGLVHFLNTLVENKEKYNVDLEIEKRINRIEKVLKRSLANQLIDVSFYASAISKISDVRIDNVLTAQSQSKEKIEQLLTYLSLENSIILEYNLGIRNTIGFMDKENYTEWITAKKEILAIETDTAVVDNPELLRSSKQKMKEILEKESLSQFMPESDHIDLEGIQSKIDSEDLILRYGQSQNKFFLIWISKEEFGYKECSREAGKSIKELVESLSCKRVVANHKFSELRNIIIGEEIELSNYKNLYVIRSENTSILPFEMIIDKDDYLIQSHNIYYLNSLKDLNNPIEKDLQEKDIVFFAPEFNSQSNISSSELVNSILDLNDCMTRKFGQLKYNLVQGKELQKKYYGDYILADESNKSSFLNREESMKNSILILSTHAYSNPNDWNRSGIALNSDDQNFLYAYEIQNLDLNAELVILSACETGVGTNMPGEGIMSLARSFSYAGCENVVNTLWEVEDESIYKIISNYLSHLEEGEKSADALLSAKRDYLKNNPSISPYFWGPLIHSGPNKQISIRTKPNYTRLIFSIIALILIAFLGYKYFAGRKKAT